MPELQTPEWIRDAIVAGFDRADKKELRNKVYQIIKDLPLADQNPRTTKHRFLQMFLYFENCSLFSDAGELSEVYKLVDEYFQEADECK